MNELAMIGRMYIEEQRLRAWLGRIATSAGYTSETLQGMAQQALAGEPSDRIAHTGIMATGPDR